jgi:hypothetical protein
MYALKIKRQGHGCVENLKNIKNTPNWCVFLLAQRRGFAPLAARPARQLSIVGFAVC